ncbi:MAG: carboxypeptidase-like regulatory domain-containing protein [Bacteroidales bacterium]|nr:carboxypeptidase-like regulatory domain-containing protein [Bacteroidales bacterium]MCF8457446.1 carboxypeptidase-like regulatory domain-containing protein [Bacteroidales bacterium]
MKKLSIFLVLICPILFSCSKDEPITSFEGNLIGYVGLVDEFSRYMPDNSGVKVSINNQDISTYSNEEGYFEIENLVSGTYTFQFEKEGFGTVMQYNYQFVGGEIPGVLDKALLFKLPIVEVDSVSIFERHNPPYYIHQTFVNCYFSRNIGQWVRFFVNDSANVSQNHIICGGMNYVDPDIEPNFKVAVAYIQIPDYMKISGKIFYFKVLLMNTKEQGYYDPSLQEKVYSSRVELPGVYSCAYP